MRSLTYVPTIHGVNEVGSVTREGLNLVDPEALHIVRKVCEIYWKSVEKGTQQLGEDFTGFKVFAEGVTDIVPNLGKVGPFSTAYRFMSDRLVDRQQTAYVLSLVASGANFIPTEDKLLHANALRENVFRDIKPTEEGWEHMRRRNEYWENEVPQIIDQNLLEGEQGLLIVGAGHRVLPRLKDDITVSFISPEAEYIVNNAENNISHFSSESVMGLMQVSGYMGYGRERF